MFEIVFLGGIAAVIYRRRVRAGDWSRGDLHRLLVDLGRGVSRAVTALLQSGPGLLRQCAADVKSLAGDMGAMARRPSRRATGKRPARRAAPAARMVPRTDAGTGGESRVFSRLQRRYIAGKISFSEYVEGVRRLRSEGAALQRVRGKAPPHAGGEAGRLAAER